ncbi:hypothetical protein [Arthrobacter sp. STN4]|uniref:hypothetical protein n=1 Tax=Arthrobacter sp. STN4 TaxID=2923276 RepID=UPI00211A498D|nr:hypothetical protein [Arthrobacter sp. STN4]MCQ9164749.1 hypothetical protein [Arthrobacter sp. STN4]
MKNGAPLIKVAATWLLILMLAIAAAIITITVVNTNSFGPARTVENYLDALRAGNGAKALGLLHGRVPSANAAVLDGPGLARSQQDLKDVKVGDPVAGPDHSQKVTVSYTIGGQALSTDFKLAQGPKRWLFFDTWSIVPTTLPVLDVSVVNANQASVNGVDVNMPNGKNSFAVFYPGSYSADYKSPLFAAPAVQRSVTDPLVSVPAVTLATGPTGELLSQVGSTIHKYLDACAKQTVLMPANCPMSAATNNRVVSAVKWSIVDYPQVSITPYGGKWIMAPLTVRAQVQYQEQDLFTGAVAPFMHAEDFGFTAKLSIAGNTVGVTPVVSY